MNMHSPVGNALLAIEGGAPVFGSGEGRFDWPLIDAQAEAAVVRQLHDSVSIYNRSGVFERFETDFAAYHDRVHALLVNSGTSALFSAMEGLGLGPNDEVICPTYTFFATISPIVHTGAKVVFCDAGADGNLDPSKLAELITPRTRAIFVTHMWGVPCDMPAIMDIARNHSLAVVEDCSHAHGAEITGRPVGSFGDIGAWSLQGQKIVTGGEGGILVTDNKEVYFRALAHGHYNKRCKSEIPADQPLAAFSTSGLGLKLRAHPLAIALAEDQFARLPQWLERKRAHAAYISEQLADIPFLRLPVFTDRQPSWYAYVMNYDAALANSVSLKAFVRALHAEGLIEADIPTSTGPIHDLPLFTRTPEVLPRLYTEPARRGGGDFPGAEAFYRTAFKIPVWVRDEDKPVVEGYVSGIRKVAAAVRSRPEVFGGAA